MGAHGSPQISRGHRRRAGEGACIISWYAAGQKLRQDAGQSGNVTAAAWAIRARSSRRCRLVGFVYTGQTSGEASPFVRPVHTVKSFFTPAAGTPNAAN